MHKYTIMSQFELKKIENDLKRFTERNFETPGKCRNLDQIRFYVKELCGKIEEYQSRFNYVPQSAYTLLAQYNQVQNQLIYINFRNTYK